MDLDRKELGDRFIYVKFEGILTKRCTLRANRAYNKIPPLIQTKEKCLKCSKTSKADDVDVIKNKPSIIKKH
jgi:hypothetical protein